MLTLLCMVVGITGLGNHDSVAFENCLCASRRMEATYTLQTPNIMTDVSPPKLTLKGTHQAEALGILDTRIAFAIAMSYRHHVG